MNIIKVIIVEDDPMVREIHRRFVDSLEGFSIAGIAANGKEAFLSLQEKAADLVILDVYMPELDGIETLRLIRESGRDLDIIMITAAQGGEIIKEASRLGVFAYLIKPFTFERFARTLESYKQFHNKIKDKGETFSQEEVDGFFQVTDQAFSAELPMGLHRATLKKTTVFMQSCSANREGVSASELGKHLNVSRVTARRYLEYLVSSGRAVVEPSYQQWGRPVNRYRLIG